jgi:PEP-CTERM putative exosortase interaction domain
MPDQPLTLMITPYRMPHPSSRRLAASIVLLGLGSAHAATLHWNSGDGAWINGAGAYWSDDAVSSPSRDWANGNAAQFNSTNPSINLWNVSATSVTVTNGLTLYASGATSPSRALTISAGGSGDITLRDDRNTGGTSAGILLSSSTTTWNGTFTIIGNPTSDVFLTIGSETTSGTASTSTATKVHLVDGGTLKVGAGSVGGVATIGELSGTGTVKLHGTFGSTQGTRTLKVDQTTNTTFTGTFGGTAGFSRGDNILAFTKAGSGTLVINGGTGVSGYAGATTVEAGKLFLTGTFGGGLGTHVTGQGDYLVKTGALLGVDGTISLAPNATRTLTVESGAILKPGTADAPGTLVIAGGDGSSTGLSFHDGAVIEFRLGAEQDFIELASASMTGFATGEVVFNFIDNGGLVVGTTYDLISFGGTTPGISLSAWVLSSASLDAGLDGVFSYGGDGNLLQFTLTAAPIPEPASAAALAGLGAVGLALASRRRRSA